MMIQIESFWPIYPHRSDYSQNASAPNFRNHYTQPAETRSKSDKCFNIYHFFNCYQCLLFKVPLLRKVVS